MATKPDEDIQWHGDFSMVSRVNRNTMNFSGKMDGIAVNMHKQF